MCVVPDLQGAAVLPVPTSLPVLGRSHGGKDKILVLILPFPDLFAPIFFPFFLNNTFIHSFQALFIVCFDPHPSYKQMKYNRNIVYNLNLPFGVCY